LKRLLDILVASWVLLLFAPVILLLVVLVRFKLGSPVFFIQIRPGRHGKPFSMVKFRTMTNKVDSDGKLLSDAERLTDFGRLLRNSSLDELPELINVLRGDMSLVGPRPLLMEYLDKYTRQQARRHEVLPGITGWAQVNGRNSLSWEEKFALDVWYVDNRSIWLDIKILILTLINIIRQKDINQAGQATMSRFKGEVNDKKR